MLNPSILQKQMKSMKRSLRTCLLPAAFFCLKDFYICDHFNFGFSDPKRSISDVIGDYLLFGIYVGFQKETGCPLHDFQSIYSNLQEYLRIWGGALHSLNT